MKKRTKQKKVVIIHSQLQYFCYLAFFVLSSVSPHFRLFASSFFRFLSDFALYYLLLTTYFHSLASSRFRIIVPSFSQYLSLPVSQSLPLPVSSAFPANADRT